MWFKLIRLLHTIRYLKFIQLVYQLKYKLFSWHDCKGHDFVINDLPNLKMKGSVTNSISLNFEDGYSFDFLNCKHTFENGVKWNYSKNGKLWVYNLNYFEFLHQKDIGVEVGLALINDFIDNYGNLKDGKEPFPTSLRLMNWIKFCIVHNVSDQRIAESIALQTTFLMNNLEWHLMGNHLLENAFALYMASFYLKSEDLNTNSLSLLMHQLDEQILKDGGHFELSPMYHSLMLYRLLDCINLVKSNFQTIQRTELGFLEDKAESMLGWLKTITFENGSIPLLNDSAQKVAPESRKIFEYAERIGVQARQKALSDCGYRVFKVEKIEAVVDVGPIGPDYIPGHAHCDMLSFVVNIDRHPFLVDTGTSTYEKNNQRTKERSTSAHNTITFEDREQSQVWGGFRVGNRARPQIIDEKANFIIAQHDGFNSSGVIHKRSFAFTDHQMEIRDELVSKYLEKGKAFLHFHPDVNISVEGNNVKSELANITIFNADGIYQKEYNYAPEFNKLTTATKVCIAFTSELIIKLKA